MKKSDDLVLILLYIIILLGTSLCFFQDSVNAEHEPFQNLRGPAFTDPLQIMDMPDTWKKQTTRGFYRLVTCRMERVY